MPSAVWPVGRVQLELVLARSRSWPGTGSAWTARSDSGARPLDVVLLVELAQLALRRRRARRPAARAVVSPQPSDASGKASGRAGGPSRRAWRAARRPGSRPARAAPAAPRARPGSTGESITNASSPAAHRACTSSARCGSIDDDRRPRASADAPASRGAPTTTPSSLAASRRFVTSASASSARRRALLVAVDPDHRDLRLQARLDVVVVARRRRGPSPSCRRSRRSHSLKCAGSGL